MLSTITGDLCNLHIEIYIWKGEKNKTKQSSCPDTNILKASCAIKLPERANKGTLRSLGPRDWCIWCEDQRQGQESCSPWQVEQAALLPIPHLQCLLDAQSIFSTMTSKERILGMRSLAQCHLQHQPWSRFYCFWLARSQLAATWISRVNYQFFQSFIQVIQRSPEGPCWYKQYIQPTIKNTPKLRKY